MLQRPLVCTCAPILESLVAGQTPSRVRAAPASRLLGLRGSRRCTVRVISPPMTALRHTQQSTRNVPRRQRRRVDGDLVDRASEEAGRAVRGGADLEDGAAGAGCRARGRVGDLRAVDIEASTGAVPGADDVVPLALDRNDGARDEGIGVLEAERARALEVQLASGVAEIATGDALADLRIVAASDPGLDRVGGSAERDRP